MGDKRTEFSEVLEGYGNLIKAIRENVEHIKGKLNQISNHPEAGVCDSGGGIPSDLKKSEDTLISYMKGQITELTILNSELGNCTRHLNDLI